MFILQGYICFHCYVNVSVGREVAMYCASHMPDIIHSCNCGNIEQALKDAFMKCDRMVIEEEAVQEMKTYDEDEIPENE